MEIATGYFARAKHYADDGFCLVSIAKVSPWFLPKGFKLHSIQSLAPTEEILKLKGRPDEYEKRYREEILSNLSAKDICGELERTASADCLDKVVLLCYESPEKFCHRHIVAKWLSEKTCVPIKEVVLHLRPAYDIFDSDSLA